MASIIWSNWRSGTSESTNSSCFKPPKGLQLHCYGLLAAVPLSKYDVEMFIFKKRIDDKKRNK